MVMPSIFASVTDTYGWEVCPCFREINNKLVCLSFVDFHAILDSSGMRSLHHVFVIVAISAQFNFSISDILLFLVRLISCLYL